MAAAVLSCPKTPIQISDLGRGHPFQWVWLGCRAEGFGIPPGGEHVLQGLAAEGRSVKRCVDTSDDLTTRRQTGASHAAGQIHPTPIPTPGRRLYGNQTLGGGPFSPSGPLQPEGFLTPDELVIA